ncbi:breast cancer metastasis-suppressor 1-like protein-A isoform X1 [Haplochromis burtoni]|uniref:breast cancer metastasis-suppressor 1-like protein-A isoform X1 n=1 Tax=Haplochromis burtoni TaxID=8153 RepID=UPI0003BC7C1D|nr:breast cancer metastasis-suppressor 1-like protein-A isoform X1 [Haplochromis burtoni]XP_005933948.1 breast cancer metastasis-suppressor 1-like protein-A isoform X1 [Haplochromis burtoni]XP_042081470.1 breast cancer metastasis-suppressor 1-like protein-A isoform X1 [Haplochromis burtoni]
MPLHRDREKKESTAEEMEAEEHEQEASSSEEEDSDTSSVSEDGDSSEMDEEDCERRRMECLDEMCNLEKQFTDLKDQLYRERLSQVNSKLAEVEAGRAAEYLEPLAVLLENMQVRTKVAGIYRELCLESVKNKYDCEIQAACQHWESEKLLLFDTVQNELEEKIRRLEEDRHSIDITSELWNDELSGRKKRRDALSPDKKRRRPSVVSGPYIVYMLPDLDILEDWTAIRKALACEPSFHNVTCGTSGILISFHLEKLKQQLSTKPWLRSGLTEGDLTLRALRSHSDLTEAGPF